MTIVCRLCNVEKVYSEYYKDPRRKLGLHTECKVCMGIVKKRWADKNRAHVNAYSRDYYYADVEHNKAKHREYMKRPEVAERTRIQMNESRKRNAAKVKIRKQTQHDIRMGRIIKLPCRVCGSLKSEAHHLDYSQPHLLDWLCRDHHMREHRRYVSRAA